MLAQVWWPELLSDEKNTIKKKKKKKKKKPKKKRKKECIYYAIEIRMICIINGTPDKNTTLIKCCVSYLRPLFVEQ